MPLYTPPNLYYLRRRPFPFTRGTNPCSPTIREVLSGHADGLAVTLVTGAGTQVGDVLVCIHGNDFDTAADLTTPTGTAGTWTLQATGDQGANTYHVKVWTRAVTSGGAQTVTVPDTGAAENFQALFVVAGADTADPSDDAAGSQGAASTSHVAPSVSPTGSNALLICASMSALTDYTAPGGMTERVEEDGDFSTLTAAVLELSASGATGTKTFTSITNAAFATASIAVRSLCDVASTGSPPQPQVLAVPTPLKVTQPTVVRSVAVTPIVSFDTPPVAKVTTGPRPQPGVVTIVTRSTADAVAGGSVPVSLVVTPTSRPVTPLPIVRMAAGSVESVPRPVVVAQSRRPTPVPPVVARSTADTPIVSFDTPPVADVVTGPTPRPGYVAVVSRSTADPTPTDTPPRSLVVIPNAQRRFGAVIVNTPRTEESTPRPATVVVPSRPPRLAVAITTRPVAELADAPPVAAVITTPGRRSVTVPTVLRSVADTPIVAGDRITAPLVLVGAGALPAAVTFVSRSFSADELCETPRPSTGLTLRPSTGSTAPAGGITLRPASGTTARPFDGTTEEPC